MSKTPTPTTTRTRAARQTGGASAEARPLYEHVADQLRDQIDSGRLGPASLLPSEAQLMATYEVSRNTARAAIAALRAEGLVTVVKGKGAIVRRTNDRPTHTDLRAIRLVDPNADDDTDADAGHAARVPVGAGRSGRGGRKARPTAGVLMDADTDAPGWRTVEPPTSYHVNATPALALAIGVAEHTPLLATERLLEDTAGRRLVHRLYVPLDTAADLPGIDSNHTPAISPAALYAALAAAGHQLAWTDYVTARNPSPDDAATLNIPNGTPALTTRRITRDTTRTTPGRPVAMEETHRSAEDTQLAYGVLAGPAE